MAIDLELQDNEFPKQPIETVRLIARAVLFNERGEVCIHRVHRDDAFGNQVYYETPGGGVDEGETFEEAVVRECEEETGYAVEIVSYLGEVRDFYNKLNRKNITRYYLCKTLDYVGKHYESKGDLVISETSFVPLDALIERYHSMDNHLVSGIVKKREIPILEEAQRQIRAHATL